MIGAIAGDIIGSVHEAAATKTKRLPLFAIMECLEIETEVFRRLDKRLRRVVSRFRERFGCAL